MRGKRAVTVVFGAVYLGDVMLNTALGLYQPSNWSGRDWVIDVGKVHPGSDHGSLRPLLARVAEPRSRWGGPAVTSNRRPYSRRLTNSVEDG